MKRLCLFVLLIFSLAFCIQASDYFIACTTATLNNLPYYKGLRTLHFEEITNKLKNYKKLLRYNWWHFRYKTDKELFGLDNYWQCPQEFFANKKGDCEDYARWNYYVLKLHGYKVQFALLRNKLTDKWHVVVKCKKNGIEKYIDQYSYWTNIDNTKWELLRLINEPPKERLHPLSYNKDKIIIKQGEMIRIPVIEQ